MPFNANPASFLSQKWTISPRLPHTYFCGCTHPPATVRWVKSAVKWWNYLFRRLPWLHMKKCVYAEGKTCNPPPCEAAEENCCCQVCCLKWRGCIQQYSCVRVNQCYHDQLTGLTWLRWEAEPCGGTLKSQSLLQISQILMKCALFFPLCVTMWNYPLMSNFLRLKATSVKACLGLVQR